MEKFRQKSPTKSFHTKGSNSRSTDGRMSSDRNKRITYNFKQVKKTPKSRTTKNDGPVPSTSTEAQHLLPDANPDLEALKQFDLCLDYGPCVGITRMERWVRAEKHGLNPPPKIKEILLKHPKDDNYTQSLWKDYNI